MPYSKLNTVTESLEQPRQKVDSISLLPGIWVTLWLVLTTRMWQKQHAMTSRPWLPEALNFVFTLLNTAATWTSHSVRMTVTAWRKGPAFQPHCRILYWGPRLWARPSITSGPTPQQLQVAHSDVGHPSWALPKLPSQGRETNGWVLFEALSFGVVCKVAIDHKHIRLDLSSSCVNHLLAEWDPKSPVPETFRDGNIPHRASLTQVYDALSGVILRTQRLSCLPTYFLHPQLMPGISQLEFNYLHKSINAY